MKKLNSYVPIWLLIIVPPLLFLTLSYNLIIVALGLFVAFIAMGKKIIFKEYAKNLLKLFAVTLLLDLITFSLMMAPEFLYNVAFIKDNFITPLEFNPYTNIISIIYMVLILALNIFIAFKFIKRIIINKNSLDLEKKIKVYSVLIIALIPYMFFIPSNMILKTDYNGLEDYRGTVIKNKSNVATILKYLDTTEYISSYVLDTYKEPYTINIYVTDIDINYQEAFEKDAAVLLYLVNDVNEVNFYKGEIRFNYTINSINKIFKNIKKLNLTDIYMRYDEENFKNYSYLGHIEKYDIFDTSEFCQTEKQVLFESGGVEYYLSCTSLDEIKLFNENSQISIKKALEQGIVTKEQILNSNLDLLMNAGDNDAENSN